jgi:23S rRNA (uridine2552-2'-O)-methyltransferase
MYKRKDAFYTRAKQEGYRSRAAYKLLELNREFQLLRRGDRVVDLGSWPGGWLQVASRLVGKEGKVVGIDLVALEPLPEENVTVLQGDASDPRVQERILTLLGHRADVVLSDMAVKLSGIKEADEARTMELCRVALVCAQELLRPGGRFLVKLFMGAEAKEFVDGVRGVFHRVKTTRPEATRKGSAEMYVIASKFKVVPTSV